MKVTGVLLPFRSLYQHLLPSEPDEPTEHTEHTEHTEPGKPSGPSGPGRPRRPSGPGEAGGPSGPGSPSRRSEPSESDDPVDPTDPTDPVDPTDPGDPADADHPDHPVHPGARDDPGESAPVGHCPTGFSVAQLKATALDLAILAGHLLLYPSGIVQERPAPLTAAPAPAPAGDDAPTRLPTEPEPKPPVILLHGFIDNRSTFVLLRRSLAQHGRQQVVSLNYSPLTCDIRTAAELLGRHVEGICHRTGSERVDIVGHSLGGLIARYYAQRLGGDLRVRTVVTLGTPHSGTRAVPLADAHPIVRQMRPGSEVIADLARPAPGCRTRFVSFWSDLDHLMDPLEAARVDHPDLLAHNVRVSGIGHLALPVHPAVANGIREALDDSAPAHDGSPAPGDTPTTPPPRPATGGGLSVA